VKEKRKYDSSPKTNVPPPHHEKIVENTEGSAKLMLSKHLE